VAAWRGHFLSACGEVAGIKGGLLQDFSNWVDNAMNFYAPFAADRKA